MTENYRTILESAIQANANRAFFAQYPEHPKAYGEDAPEKGAAAYKEQLGKPFAGLLQGDAARWIGEEESPYTREALGITYPAFPVAELIDRAAACRKGWKQASPDKRAEVLIDSLERVKDRFFEIAHATMHTTGQSFVMSFQASGPHANDRALEAIAMAYAELTRFPAEQQWVKPMGKFDLEVKKIYKPVPLGIGLVVGCSTFPIWNSVPGIYASLATGNPVIVKPHPKSVYPIAIVVAELQQSLEKYGFDPNTVQLAVDASDALITKELAEHSQVKLIDYTGGSAFGDYLEGLTHKVVFTEKAGVNSVILDSVVDLNAVLQNLSFAVSLYSGQMCTAPQNFFIPEEGIKEGDTVIPYEEVVHRLRDAIHGLVTNPKAGPGTLGAIQNQTTLERALGMKDMNGSLVLGPDKVDNPEFANARICTPAIVEADADSDYIRHELFGPIILVIKTRNTEHSIARASELAATKGAISCAAYTTDAATEAHLLDAMEDAAVSVAINLTGFIWVNQNAAFSDFHVSGGNPAGNASFTNPAYVNRRFVWLSHKKVG